MSESKNVGKLVIMYLPEGQCDPKYDDLPLSVGFDVSDNQEEKLLSSIEALYKGDKTQFSLYVAGERLVCFNTGATIHDIM